jgi:anti-sigma regulatory factor (Ser/Thr protein kinase)
VEFGQEQLIRLLAKTSRQSLATGVRTLEQRLRDWNGPKAFVDDMTLLVLSYTAGAVCYTDAEASPVVHRAFEIEGTVDQAVEVRRFVSDFCTKDVPAESRIEDPWPVELAVHETVTNVALHAIEQDGNPMIRIEGLAFGDRIEFLVVYDGRSFDPEQVPKPLLDGSQTAHFGLHMVDLCMDEVEYRTQCPGEKCIRLVKNHPQTAHDKNDVDQKQAPLAGDDSCPWKL